MRLSEKPKKLLPYLKERDGYRLLLESNESFISLPDEIRDKISRAVRDVPFNLYPDPEALGVSRAVSELYGVPAECVVSGVGSDEIIYTLHNAFAFKNDAVLISEPDFFIYNVAANNAELKLLSVPKTNFEVNVDEIIETVKREKPAFVIFSNPCNPTGKGISKEEVVRLYTSVDCPVVVDEAYMDFWDQSVLPDALSAENVIVLRTCSKALGCAGLRLGFAIANPELAGYIKRAKAPYNVNVLTQTAGEILLRETEYRAKAIVTLQEATLDLYNKLMALSERFPGVLKPMPTLTNFVLSEANDSARIAAALEARGILVRFWPGLLRISTGTLEQNEEFYQEFADILEKGAY
ncbi:histidinol-phosphate aminotransferase family protein [Oscillospiraceae bacterium OttesenSCG-928-G22]|nr:histidinol-phosphate aminotransferase family protein [Oscillospiraceae bacterium OttesenSCG-928-G22]